jgi:hypothetical protein
MVHVVRHVVKATVTKSAGVEQLTRAITGAAATVHTFAVVEG